MDMSADHKRNGKRRVFTKLWNAESLLQGLQSMNGAFVPTRLPVRLGEELVLAARLEGVKRPIELPVVVVGRRAFRGAHANLAAGILVRLSVVEHPMKDLLTEVASGKVVDLETRLQRTLRVRTSSRFSSRGEFVGEISAMLRGELGLFPVNRQVFIGDRVATLISAGDGPSDLELDLVVRGLAHRDDLRAFLCEFFDAGERQKAKAYLSASTPHELSA